MGSISGSERCWSVGVFLLSCVGCPSQSGFKSKAGRSQAWDALHYADEHRKSIWYEAQKQFIRFFRDAPGIVLSDIDPPYVNVLLPKPFVAAPIDDRRNYDYSPIWHLRESRISPASPNWPRSPHSCYALLVASINHDQDVQRLPSIQGTVGNGAKIQFKGCNHDIDKRCRHSDVGFGLRLSAMISNEVVRSYSML